MWALFKEMFVISCFTFGGGYVMVTLMQERFVQQLHWLEQDDVLDLVAIAQSAPGALAINGSIMLGYSLLGLKGALVSVIGVVIPPLFIIGLAAYFYDLLIGNAMFELMLVTTRAAVAAVIVNVVLNMSKDVFKSKDLYAVLLLVVAFVLTYFFNVSVVHVVLFCILLGVVSCLRKRKQL